MIGKVSRVKRYFNAPFKPMSKLIKAISLALVCFVQILQLFNNCEAQNVEAKITVSENSATVAGQFAEAVSNGRNFSFVRDYAGAENLGERVSGVILGDKNGHNVAAKKFMAGEYAAEQDFQGFQYQINLRLPENSAAAAHISALSAENGILMLGDLLPESAAKRSAKITFALPPDWQILTSEKKLGENSFETADADRAIFYVGKNLRIRQIAAENARIELIISGENQFSDAEAVKMAREIFEFYDILFGASPANNVEIFLGKFAASSGFGRWEAETRGSNVTVFSAGNAFKSQSLQLLHEQLRHEIFHLWMPNNLNLSGSYDWFYEGFALYQALRTGIAVNRIRFEDFLDTLSRAHAIDGFQTDHLSLIEASKNRFHGANTLVYARGMLVAFLCDLALLQKSKGKISLDKILRQIYDAHRYPNARTDGSEAILKILQAHPELSPVIEKYIRGTAKINWQNDLAAFGIESAEDNVSTKLKIKAKLSGREKDLLDKLGYNNWRKLSSDLK